MKSFYKNKFMRKYEVDLWGDLVSYKKINRFFNKMFWIYCYKYRFKLPILRLYFRKKRNKNFNYSTLIPKRFFRKFYTRYYIKRLHILRRLRTYYGVLNLKKFRKYLKSSLKRNIDFTSSLLMLLECRLDVLLWRINLFKSLKEIKFIIMNTTQAFFLSFSQS